MILSMLLCMYLKSLDYFKQIIMTDSEYLRVVFYTFLQYRISYPSTNAQK